MPKYHIIVHCDNCVLNTEEKPEQVGFFTSCFVEAADSESAEVQAVDLVRQRMERDNIAEYAPLLIVERVRGVHSFRGFPVPGDGFAFYEHRCADALDTAYKIESSAFLPWWMRLLPSQRVWIKSLRIKSLLAGKSVPVLQS